jgi:hypothetical protein
VHIELVYGRWLWFFKNNLNLWQTVVTSVFVILAMLALSYVRTNYDRLKTTLGEMGWWYNARPGGAEGD